MSPPGLGPIHRFEEIDSTNRYLVDQARRGAAHGLVAVAGHQSAGRGRLGRTWEAPPGANLLMSVLLRPGGLPLQAVTVAVALAAADACKTISGVEPGLKWPNDLVVDDSKLAGVLAEAVFPAGAQVGGAEPAGVEPAIVVGLGLNVGWSPPDEVDAYLPGATSLSRLVGPGSPKAALEVEVLLVAVLDRLAARLDDLTSVGGLTGQAEEHRLRCVTLGRSVRVEEPAESFTGTAVSISDEGHLVVETLSGRRTVTAGDVVHLRHQVGESGAELPDPADPPAMGLAKAP